MFQIRSEHDHDHAPDCPPDQAPAPQPQPQPRPRRVRIQSLPDQNASEFLIADCLVPCLEQSIQPLPELVFEAITDRRRRLEMFVYSSLVEEGTDYLRRLAQPGCTRLKYLPQMIEECVASAGALIVGEILEGQHHVHKIARPKKEQLYGQSKVTEAAIRIREEMLKAKLSDLKSDINLSNIEAGELDPMTLNNPNSSDLYAENSHQTKKAKQFIKKMQEVQAEQRRAREQAEEFKRQKRLEQQAEKKEIEERMRREKHEDLKRHYQAKREQKQQERKEQQARNEDFQKFLSQFKGKTPLFQKKQQQFFIKYVIPENNKKLQILKQIKQQRKPLNHQDLKQHQKQYLEIKQDYHYEKNAGKALEEKAKKPEKNYYKSKFHSLIEQQQQKKLEEPDEFDLKLKLLERKQQYCNEIKTKFVPKVDPKKRQQIVKRAEQLDWVSRMRKSSDHSTDNYKKDGKDNLQKLHKYIAELKAKGKIRSTSASRTIDSTPATNSARYKNYLHELRDSGASTAYRSGRAYSIDYGSMLQRDDPERIKMSLKAKQQAVSRREQYLASLGNRNLQKYMEEKKRLDDDYLESAKAKMAIINKFQ